jgi:hypothetical protein
VCKNRSFAKYSSFVRGIAFSFAYCGVQNIHVQYDEAPWRLMFLLKSRHGICFAGFHAMLLFTSPHIVLISTATAVHIPVYIKLTQAQHIVTDSSGVISSSQNV